MNLFGQRRVERFGIGLASLLAKSEGERENQLRVERVGWIALFAVSMCRTPASYLCMALKVRN
jgi:hypothetical protein